MTNIICAICDTNANAKLLYKANFDNKAFTNKIYSARRMPDRVHFQFLKCYTCGLIFSSPIVSFDKIINLYKQSDFTYQTESTYLAESYAYYLSTILPIRGRNKLSLLDIGCGNGFFLEKAKDMGIGHVFGVEPGKLSVMKTRPDIRKNIKVDIFRKGLYKDSFFDIICCFQTLDHIINPNMFLQLVYKALKKNGKILFVTHNTSGLSVKLFGEKSPIFDIEHIYLFNEQTLTDIILKNNFRKTKIYNLKNTYPLQFWLRQSPMPKPLKQLLLSVINSIKIGTKPISIQAGNIAITATK